MAGKLIKEDKRWAAEHDAHTLKEAHMIMSDNKRHTEAKKAAKRMMGDMMKETKALNRVAKRGGHRGK